MHRKHYIVLFIFVAGICACNKDTIEEIFPGFKNPGHFPEPTYHFATNTVTKAGFELGRKLFFDPILSANNSISCGSCHIPTAAFTHHGHSVSHGIFDQLGTRNSPPIMNLAWNKSFMWDGGVGDLDLQPIAPITNHVEMDENVANVLSKLQNKPGYPPMFEKAFGSAQISSANFLKALSQYMLMCVSDHAKYDSVINNKAVFTQQEEAGYLLFKQKCKSCHTEPLFTDNTFKNNGLSISMLNDMGRYLVTLQDIDKYKFKVPSLRNLGYTAPYMHDGRFFTLEAVMDHYSNQVQNTQNLDPLFQQGSQLGIALTPEDKLKLIAFLQTLDDKIFVTDKTLAEH